MSQTYDVINISDNEGTSKMKTYDHSKVVIQNRVLNIFPFIYDEKLSRGDFDIHRSLPEGQEIDRQSKIKKT